MNAQYLQRLNFFKWSPGLSGPGAKGGPERPPLRAIVMIALLCLSSGLVAQGVWLDHRELLKPLSDTWPTYSGDYSGKRFSALTQVNKSNVKALTLAWTARFAGGRAGGGAPTITGGEGPDAAMTAGGANI